jgi:hypothetical protein
MVQRQNSNCGRQPDPSGHRRDRGKQHVRAGVDAQRVEMMLTDPGRVVSELVGMDRLFTDLQNELLR